jgi:hypothetical protein
MLLVLPLRGLLFLSTAAPDRNLVSSEGKPWTRLSIFLAGVAAGTGSGRTKGDELRADADKPSEAFAFLARGGVPLPCASAAASRAAAGELDLAAARAEGFRREDGAAAAEGAAGLALSADRALLHVAVEPSTDDAPGLGDAHRRLAAGGAAGGSAGLNLEGISLLRPAGAAAALFFSDGTSGRRCAPSAAAPAFLRSPFTASMKK